VAEAAMRASIAEVSLSDAMGGAGRARVEQNVRDRMQAVLDTYRAGVQIQGVEIKKADPPTKVISAFQQVTAAQQDAQRDLSNAQAWSQQTLALAQGTATSFDKVYEQYKLAPEVTRRRMYYETMEQVLGNNDKVIVEANGVTPFLALPEMRKRAQAVPEVPAAAAPAKGAQ
jgi:membrane protease subunit HflK